MVFITRLALRASSRGLNDLNRASGVDTTMVI